MYIFVSVVQPSVMSVRFTTTNITVCIKSFCLVSKSSLTLFQTFELYVACWAPLYMGFPRQEYQNGLPFPPLGDLPNPGIKPMSPVSPALAAGFFTTEPPGKPQMAQYSHLRLYTTYAHLPVYFKPSLDYLSPIQMLHKQLLASRKFKFCFSELSGILSLNIFNLQLVEAKDAEPTSAESQLYSYLGHG